MRDHELVKVLDFGGLFSGGEPEQTPFDHLREAYNVWYLPRGLRSRPQSVADAATIRGDNILRSRYYVDGDGDLHNIILNEDNELVDVSVDPSVVILTVAGMTDFSLVPMFGRVYITPHDGQIGIEDGIVYVYLGSGVARAAGGAAPAPAAAGANQVLNTAFPGEMTEGRHGFAVAYEYDTGFITPPGYFYEHFSDGSRGLENDVPLGPTGVVARHILMTKARAELDAALENLDYYFALRIDDNTTEDGIDISILDGDLIDPADYLFDLLTYIPAGAAIHNYNGRLCVGGEFDNPAAVRISRSGDPETISEVDGILSVNPGDAAYAVTNLWTHRENLIINKVGRTYATSDRGDIITDWAVGEVDGSIGAGPHSVGRIALFGQTLQDIGIVANADGLHLYNGVYAGLRMSEKISSIWSRINEQAAHTIDVAIDSKRQVIYCAIPLDSATRPSHILMVDYVRGLKPDSIRWSVWTLPYDPQSVVVITQPGNEEQTLRVASYGGDMHSISFNAAFDDKFPNPSTSVPVNVIIRFALMPNELQENFQEGDYHHGGAKFRVRGVGSLTCIMYGQDDLVSETMAPITLSEAPGQDVFRLCNLVSPRASVRIQMNVAGSWMVLTRFVHLVKWLWSERAN